MGTWYWYPDEAVMKISSVSAACEANVRFLGILSIKIDRKR